MKPLSEEAKAILRDAPRDYVVKGGDTLWDIAERELGDPFAWVRLWQANPQIEDPDLIYPGDTLHLHRRT